MSAVKVCGKCKLVLPFHDFSMWKGSPVSACRKCKTAHTREYEQRPENKERVKAGKLAFKKANRELVATKDELRATREFVLFVQSRGVDPKRHKMTSN